MIVLALENLVDKVRDQFTEDAAGVSLLCDANFSGAATLAGTPTDFSEVVVEFTVGGTVGVDGIIYHVSVDNGGTYAAPVALGVGDSISVLGMTVTLSGTVTSGDVLSWDTASPVLPVFRFGSRAPWQSGDQYRISYVPGDEADAGEIVQARQPGRNPRPLHTFNERVSVYIEASDETSAEDERAQWRATRLLFNAWVRCVYLVARGTYKFDKIEILNERSTRRHGYCYRAVLVLDEMIPDVSFGSAPVNVGASLLTSLNSQTDGPDAISHIYDLETDSGDDIDTDSGEPLTILPG